MSDRVENETVMSGMSWKVAAVGSGASAVATLATLGNVPIIISGLMLLAAVGWGLTARDNRRKLRRSQS